MANHKFFAEFWEAQSTPSVKEVAEPRFLGGIRLADIHVHIDPLRYVHKHAAQAFGGQVGDFVNSWLTPRHTTITSVLHHICKDRLEQVGAIFEDSHSLVRLKKAVGSRVEIVGFYFVRNLGKALALISAAQNVVEVQAIKLHPVRDWFPLNPSVLDQLCRFAIDYNLPVAIHSDDRNPDTIALAEPRLFERLAAAHTKLKILILHGIYASPRLVGMNSRSLAYWSEDFKPISRRRILLDCLGLARDFPNIFLDLSIVTNKVKALLVARFINENPEVVGKIFLGTDYPIRQSSLISQIKALHLAGVREDLLLRIVGNRFSDILAV